MPITSLTTDPETLTLTLVGDYPVPVERLWEAYVDPRQIERFWGPPGWPATFTRHDVAVGGESHYYMTGPEGERSAGYWRYEAVEQFRRLDVVDGFAGDDGQPNASMPSMRMTFRFESTDTGSRMTNVTTFPDLESMEQLAEMGMVEGTKAAVGQLDDLLADLADYAAGRETELTLLDDTHIRTSRVVRGSVDDVWRAHHDADLLRRWMLGPDGWTMPVCEPAGAVGDGYRYQWQADDGAHSFGFEGECLELAAPYRAVSTERMIGTDGPTVTNELSLVPVQGGTLVSNVATYPSKEVRDQILETGMVDGIEQSYARLDDVLASEVAASS